LPEDAAKTEVAIITTNLGQLVVGFWTDVAPNTVANFKKLARQGFYDGTAFHRIVRGFMIQGGDPLTKDPGAEDRWGTGGPGYEIQAEFNDRPHARGVISMARSQHPDSAGSQFFICLAEARFLDGQYTAFGQLLRGDDVLGRIGDTPTVMGSGGELSQPTNRVSVESIRLAPADALK
jgi:peptidyl-prolyl cis-trans isomerase B (cyclophilin B)